jgi:hypothetical protein
LGLDYYIQLHGKIEIARSGLSRLYKNLVSYR